MWWTVIRHNDGNGEGFQAYLVASVAGRAPEATRALGELHRIAPVAGRTWPSDFDVDAAQWYAQADGVASGLACDPGYTPIDKPAEVTRREHVQRRLEQIALRASLVRTRFPGGAAPTPARVIMTAVPEPVVVPEPVRPVASTPLPLPVVAPPPAPEPIPPPEPLPPPPVVELTPEPQPEPEPEPSVKAKAPSRRKGR